MVLVASLHGCDKHAQDRAAIGKLKINFQHPQRSRPFGSRQILRLESTPCTVRFVLENGPWNHNNAAYERAIEGELRDYLKDHNEDKHAALLNAAA